MARSKLSDARASGDLTGFTLAGPVELRNRRRSKKDAIRLRVVRTNSKVDYDSRDEEIELRVGDEITVTFKTRHQVSLVERQTGQRSKFDEEITQRYIYLGPA